jgi:hypothetical protein
VGDAWRRDVCAALALAHVAAANDALSRPTPDTVSGYQALEHASALLRAAGAPPRLAARAAAALDDAAPDFALEALAAPLGARATRAAGRRVLRALLWSTDATTGALSPRLRDRDAFAAAAAPSLTASETASLFFDAPPAARNAAPPAVAAAAVARLAAGFAARRPRWVRAAAAALAALPPSEDAAAGDAIAVARAVAAMLLGDADAAAAALRLDAPGGVGAPAGVPAFVARHDSRLAGLVALSEAWLADVALPRFRDTAGSSRSLSGWFDTPSVGNGLADADKPAPLRLLSDALAAASERRAAAADDAAGAAPDYTRRPARAGAGARAAAAGALLAGALCAGGALSSSSSSVSSPAAAAAERLAATAAYAAYATGDALSDAAGAVLRRGSAAPMDSALAAAVVRRWQAVKAAALGGAHDVSALDSILEARGDPRGRMLCACVWRSSARAGARQRDADARALICALISVSHHVSCVCVCARRGPCCGSGARARRTCATTASTGARAPPTTTACSRIVHICMHSFILCMILTPLLCPLRCREYILNGLTIDALRVSDDGASACVDATLTEAAVLHDGSRPSGSGKGDGSADAYESTYKARYELARRAGGGGGARAWRVVSGTVLS